MRGIILVLVVAFAVCTLASGGKYAASKASPKSAASPASAARAASAASAAAVIPPAYSYPSRYLKFLLTNKSPVSNLPMSFVVPKNYFEDIINATYVNSTETFPEWYCGYAVSATAEAQYTIQQEQVLASLGLAIYDGAVRMIALSLLGHGDAAQNYTAETLVAAKTLQFTSVRMGSNCGGITAFGQLNPDYTLCYGGNDAAHTHNNVPNENAFINQIISDYYNVPLQDVRCPYRGFTWNNWQPITGDNIWANFIGPLQSAYLIAQGDFSAIADNNTMLMNAVLVFPTVELMIIPSLGGIARAPYGTYPDPAGGLVSVENCLSTIAAMEMFKEILVGKPGSVHAALIPRIDTMLTGLYAFTKTAYDAPTGVFKTMGLVHENLTYEWLNPGFAVDCQTWAITALGPNLIDSWFGRGAALKMWHQTKAIGGYMNNGVFSGVGYSNNTEAQILSGEWTFGAINAVRTLRRYYQDPAIRASLTTDEANMRNTVEQLITGKVAATDAIAIQYASRRYFIPFGWYANPFPALASTGWAVFVDMYYNPFQLGGSYVYA